MAELLPQKVKLVTIICVSDVAHYSYTLSAEAKMVLQTFATSKGFNKLVHLHSLNRFYAICRLHV